MKLLFRLCFAFNLDLKFYFFGRVGGWLEKVKLKLNSTQLVVEVEVRVELGNISTSLLVRGCVGVWYEIKAISALVGWSWSWGWAWQHPQKKWGLVWCVGWFANSFSSQPKLLSWMTSSELGQYKVKQNSPYLPYYTRFVYFIYSNGFA